MAQLTKDQVLKLAALSRLSLHDDEVATFQKELSKILAYVEQLDSIDVEGLKPAYQVGGTANKARVDEAIEYQSAPSELRKLPPQKNGNYIQVGRMIE